MFYACGQSIQNVICTQLFIPQLEQNIGYVRNLGIQWHMTVWWNCSIFTMEYYTAAKKDELQIHWNLGEIKGYHVKQRSMLDIVK